MAVPETLKRQFVNQFRSDITIIRQALCRAERSIAIYKSNNFAPGEADQITDGHLAILGVTVVDLVKGKALIDNLIKFVKDGTPAQADYEETFNILRNDFGI